MSHHYLTFHNISFSYESMSHDLFSEVSIQFCEGWTGVIGANGVGKTTLLKLAAGILTPQPGHIQIPGNALYCAQRTDHLPELLAGFIESQDAGAFKIKEQLEIQDDWITRWSTLSYGERKRSQLAVALWQQPLVLCIDEPTNHLDSAARDMLFHALQQFSGIGILVSHDRELLDMLCQHCVFVEPPEVTVRPGNYTKAMQQAALDDASVRNEFKNMKQRQKKLTTEIRKRKQAVTQSKNKNSKRKLHKKDHDARAKIDLARLSGKDGQAGRRLSQLEGRFRQSQQKFEQVKAKLKKTHEMGIWFEGGYSKRNVLFRLAPQKILLGANRWLEIPELVMTPTDRVALTGLNGVGKSILVRYITESLHISDERLTYLPQEISLDASKEIIDEVRACPNDQLGHLMTVVSRLGSRPFRLLETEAPSPGEIRKMLLATGIVRMPYLIIMDEPTNHLDLPSIECLETALKDCPCGLLLVSHDRQFLNKLTTIHWHISRDNGRSEVYHLKVIN